MYLFLIETFILEQDDPLERNYSIMEKINTDFFERTLDNEIYVRLCFVTLNKFQYFKILIFKYELFEFSLSMRRLDLYLITPHKQIPIALNKSWPISMHVM